MKESGAIRGKKYSKAEIVEGEEILLYGRAGAVFWRRGKSPCVEEFDVTKKNFAKMRGMVEREKPKPALFWREIWPRCEGKGMMIRIGGLEISSWGQVESLAKSQEEERTLKEALGAPERIAPALPWGRI